MSVNLYDEALLQKLKYWTEKADIRVYGVDDSRRLLEVLANNTNDKSIKLPIIAIRRTDGFRILNTNKKPTSYDGLPLTNGYNELYDTLRLQFLNREITREQYNKKIAELKNISDESSTAQVNSIPISIRYKLDVYTRYQKENDLYMRNLIFNIINYPTLQVEFVYNGIEMKHNGNIYLGDNNVVADSGSIRIFADQICKQTLDIVIDVAQLWDLRLRKNASISNGGLYIKEQDGWTYEEIDTKVE